jgi:hypothetical protein
MRRNAPRSPDALDFAIREAGQGSDCITSGLIKLIKVRTERIGAELGPKAS